MRSMPPDVPIHRPSVGAMSLASGSRMPNPIKFYVYRGSGEDTMQEAIDAAAWEEERAEREAKARAERRAARQRADVERKRIRDARAAARAAYDALPLAPVIPLFPNGPPPVPAETPTPATQSPAPRPPRPRRPVRPAPGWKPPTADDWGDFLDD